ncbi:MAG: hypothetical protein QOF52_1372 [Propionibacteriaceae bacterium]|jgi:nucleoid-associated protein YgaU|nr:hypothetical protein [Propionibacteriaceae bacterium]MDX6321514.1 hypothetical protein [Propionibacteriaceae bacterium]
MRFVRGVVSLAVLVGGLIGVPIALVLLAGNPLPDRLAWFDIRRTLSSPDDGSVLVAIIVVIAWLAWLVFALATLTEIVRIASAERIRLRLSGLAGSQRFAAGLILSVLALGAAPQLGHAEPLEPPVATGPDQGSEGSPEEGGGRTGKPPDAPKPANLASPAAHRSGSVQIPSGAVRHLVVRGDDLWSLAERYYGHGREWRRIAVANSQLLTGGPDRLQPGWRLVIPGARGEAGQADGIAVRAGDTLSSIAEDLYGDAGRWPELYEANHAQLSDPDDLEPGMHLKRPPADQPNVARSDEPTTKPDPGRAPTSRRPVAPEPTRAPQPPVERVPATNRPARPEPTQAPQPPDERVPRANRPAAPVSSAPVPPAQPSPEQTHEGPESAIAIGLSSVGGLLAAGVISALALRRRMQLQARPLGRRILHPGDDARQVEVTLAKRQRPLSLRTLDLATRAIAAQCRHTSGPLPDLRMATVADDRIELVMETTAVQPPVGFILDGASWRLDPADADYLRSVPGVGEAPRPYPTLVSVGHDPGGAQQLLNLEAVGLLSLRSDSPDLVEAALVALAVELSTSVWADELIITVVGTCTGLPEALGRHNVTRADDLDEVLARAEERAAMQRRHDPDGTASAHRVDPDFADPWVPEVLLVAGPVTSAQSRRLVDLTTSLPRVTIAAVVSTDLPAAPWSLHFDAPQRPDGGTSDSQAAGDPTAVLKPVNRLVTPQLIRRPAADALLALLACTGSESTDPAPWWQLPTESPPAPEASNVRYLGPREDGGEGVGTATEGEAAAQTRRWTQMDGQPGGVGTVHGPSLLLMGPVDLVGAAGTVPPRAARQCLEYCGWLLEHPGTTAQAMTSALLVAEGTRRSNMSRLRTWLGADSDGQPYLPDAYSGRISLQPTVSSDWIQFRILTGAGVPSSSTQALRAALQLVRGAPLADTAPGQWHWAEELRIDMISAIRDTGVELATRALIDHDIDLARWAAARALVAAPGDELLLRARISTEHQAGNRPEVERLTLQLAAQARTLGVDLDPETVELLQEVMEGQVRARFA